MNVSLFAMIVGLRLCLFAIIVSPTQPVFASPCDTVCKPLQLCLCIPAPVPVRQCTIAADAVCAVSGAARCTTDHGVPPLFGDRAPQQPPHAQCPTGSDQVLYALSRVSRACAAGTQSAYSRHPGQENRDPAGALSHGRGDAKPPECAGSATARRHP